MKNLMKVLKAARIIFMFLFIVGVMPSCEEDTEIFDDSKLQIEMATDDEDEKKQGPGS